MPLSNNNFKNIVKHVILVGGVNPSEKYESVGIIIPNIWTNKK
jgi:hypothetical protein